MTSNEPKLVEESDTLHGMNFLHFFTMKTQNITMETNKKSDSTKSRFVDAQVALMSNPFHHEPIGEVESMEDLLAINNPYERRDMLQSSENKKKQQQISNGSKKQKHNASYFPTNL